jgi:hypothetical protein
MESGTEETSQALDPVVERPIDFESALELSWVGVRKMSRRGRGPDGSREIRIQD